MATSSSAARYKCGTGIDAAGHSTSTGCCVPFDRIRFYEVDAAELKAMRESFPRGGVDIDIETTSFDIEQHRAFLAAHRDDIDAFAARRRHAFAAELADWRERGLLTFEQADPGGRFVDAAKTQLDDGSPPFVVSPLAGSIWAVAVEPGPARGGRRHAVRC